MKKPTLCLIFGGKSSEYDVSLCSFYNILQALDKEKYKIIKIGITKEGRWLLYKGNGDSVLNDRWQTESKAPVSLDINRGAFIIGKKRIVPDIVFPVLHGEYYEDGRIQGLFDTAGIKYVGCDAFASCVCFDKEITKLVAKSVGVPVANGVLLTYGNTENEERVKALITKAGYPLFVKPAEAGSSIGVSEAKSNEELSIAIQNAFKVSKRVLVEEKIEGTETELAVLEVDGKAKFSVTGQIKHTAEFYDYKAKYESKETKYIIPAEISNKTQKYLEECAKKLYFALGIKGLCRMDFFACKNGEVVFNEVNTMPGFTMGSMFSMLFEAENVLLRKILNNILNL